MLVLVVGRRQDVEERHRPVDCRDLVDVAQLWGQQRRHVGRPHEARQVLGGVVDGAEPRLPNVPLTGRCRIAAVQDAGGGRPARREGKHLQLSVKNLQHTVHVRVVVHRQCETILQDEDSDTDGFVFTEADVRHGHDVAVLVVRPPVAHPVRVEGEVLRRQLVHQLGQLREALTEGGRALRRRLEHVHGQPDHALDQKLARGRHGQAALRSVQTESEAG